MSVSKTFSALSIGVASRRGKWGRYGNTGHHPDGVADMDFR